MVAFNPAALQYEVRYSLPELSDESKKKVCQIEDLNKIQMALVGEPLSSAQFDYLYSLTNTQLHNMVYEQENVLRRRSLGIY